MDHFLHLCHVLVAIVGATLVGREAVLVLESLEVLCDLLRVGGWGWEAWNPAVQFVVSERYVQTALQPTLA